MPRYLYTKTPILHTILIGRRIGGQSCYRNRLLKHLFDNNYTWLGLTQRRHPVLPSGLLCAPLRLFYKYVLLSTLHYTPGAPGIFQIHLPHSTNYLIEVLYCELELVSAGPSAIEICSTPLTP